MASVATSRAPGRQDDVLRRATGLQRRAWRAVQTYRFNRAGELLREALTLIGPVDPDSPPEPATVRIRVLVSLAYVEAESGSASGLRRLDAARDQVDSLEPGPVRSELDGLVLQQRGFLLIRAGRDEDGLELLDEAVPRLAAGLASGAGDPHVLASTYLNRGLAYINLSRAPEAAAEFHRCVQVCERHQLDQLAAKARHNLGYVAYMVGDMPTALRHYAQTDRSYRTLATGLLPTLWLDQARALLAAGLAADAARHLDDALPQLRRQRAGQDVAEAEVARAAAALLDGQVGAARRWARSAERHFAKRGNERWAAIAALTALRAETVAALAGGRIPRGLPTRAVKLADTLRGLLLDDEMAVALMLAVRMELRRGDPAAAAVLLDQVPRPRATSPVDSRMLRRLCRAELGIAEGNRRRALAEARAGLTELGRVRDRMGGLELLCGTAIHGQELGELAVRQVLGAPRMNARQLFGWLERTRAQIYRYEPEPAIDDPVLAGKVAELRSLRRMAQLARAAGQPAAQQAKKSAALEREILREGWYTTPWGRPRPVATFADVADSLGDRALVTFAASGDELVAVVVTAAHARLVRLGSASAAAEFATRLHADLDALAPDHLPGPLAAAVTRSATRSADVLDAQLVRPLSTVLDHARALDSRLLRPLSAMVGSRELVVVPTGALYAVAWGSLPSLRGWPVVVAPSATAWLAAERGTRSGSRVVLARGPLLGEEIAEEGPLGSTYPDPVRLHGPQATVGAVLEALDGAGIAHLAAHGAHEPTNALFSRLELADGPLFAHELARLRQPPRQVVLAACELAMNHIRPGDEALGFAGALLAGGVRTVVAAISRVGDIAAANAMVDYHAKIASGERPAVALAQAVAADPFRRPFICLGAG
jgi:tetratricopeptide (TPR) repeat protein